MALEQLTVKSHWQCFFLGALGCGADCRTVVGLPSMGPYVRISIICVRPNKPNKLRNKLKYATAVKICLRSSVVVEILLSIVVS